MSVSEKLSSVTSKKKK